MLRTLLRPRQQQPPVAAAAPAQPSPQRSAGVIQVRLVGAQLVLTSSASRTDVLAEGPVIVERGEEGTRVTEPRPGAEPRPVCRLIVPVGATVELQSETGGLAVFQFRGTLRARLRFGDARANHIEGRLRIISGTGAVTVEHLRGGLDVMASSGHVVVRQINGDVQAVSDSGSLEFEQIGGPLVARSTTGGIKAADLGGSARLSTRTGAIDVAGAQRQLTVRTQSGDISWKGSVIDHTTLETFKGRVEVKLGSVTDARIEASARQGVVRSERIALAPGSTRRTVRAVVGNGRARLRLSTGLGVVDITGPARQDS